MKSLGNIQLACPLCRKMMQIPNSAGGKVARCPGCHSRMRISSDLRILVPFNSTAPPATAPSAPSVLRARSSSRIPNSTSAANDQSEPPLEKKPLKIKILWGMVVITSLIVMGLLFWLIYELSKKDPKIEFNYLPDDCYAMLVFDRQTFEQCEFKNTLNKELPQLLKQFKSEIKGHGLEYDNVLTITIAFGNEGPIVMPLTVFECGASISEDQMPWKKYPKKYKKKNFGGKEVYLKRYTRNPPMAYYLADDKTLVYGAELTISNALKRKRKAIFIRPAFKKLYESTKFDQPIVGIIDFKGYANTFVKRNHKRKKPILPGFDNLSNFQTGTMKLSFDSAMNLNIEVFCKDREHAQTLQKNLQNYIVLLKTISSHVGEGEIPQLEEYQLIVDQMEIQALATIKCKDKIQAKLVKNNLNYYLHLIKRNLNDQRNALVLMGPYRLVVKDSTVNVEINIVCENDEYAQQVHTFIEQLRDYIKILLISKSESTAFFDSLDFTTNESSLDISLKITTKDIALFLHRVLQLTNQIDFQKSDKSDETNEENSQESVDQQSHYQPAVDRKLFAVCSSNSLLIRSL